MGGNASDEQIVKESRLLDLLEKGDSVMADKGFLIQDLLGGTLNISPPKKTETQIGNCQEKRLSKQRELLQ